MSCKIKVFASGAVGSVARKVARAVTQKVTWLPASYCSEETG